MSHAIEFVAGLVFAWLCHCARRFGAAADRDTRAECHRRRHLQQQHATGGRDRDRQDKSGKTIEGLTAKDFTVTEDGAPQTIKFFEYQKLPDVARAPAAQPTGDADRSEQIPAHADRARNARQHALQGSSAAGPVFRYDRDAAADQLRALDAARKFIRTQMTPADLMAIMLFHGGAVDVLQDFTDDRDRLLSIIETIVVGEGAGLRRNRDRRQRRRYRRRLRPGRQRIQHLQYRSPAGGAADRGRMLGQLNEKKALLYFASGLQLNGIDNQAQLHATVNAAIRAGVSFWPIDARGLVARRPLGDATRGSPGGTGMYTGTSALALHQQLPAVAGHACTRSRPIPAARRCSTTTIWPRASCRRRRPFRAITSSAITRPTQTLDGKFRRDQDHAEQRHRPPSSIIARATSPARLFNKFTAADKERQLEDALMLGDPITELTIAHGGGLLPVESRRVFRARSWSRFRAANWRWRAKAARNTR